MIFRLISTWVVLLAVSSFTFASMPRKFIDVHEIGSNKLTSMEQVPPVDPALHSFPTVPTVPVVPTCVKSGYLRDPFNCGKFYYCGTAAAVPAAFYCEHGLIFDTVSNRCSHPAYVHC